MKQIVLKIPENKYSFILELLKNFSYLKIEEEYQVPEFHKDIVRERSAASEKDPSRVKKWDDVKDSVKY